MIFKRTGINGLYLIEHKKLEDERGFFSRTYCSDVFQTHGFSENFVQFNHSFNIKRGTIRGLHFQKPPFGETKLIRCVKGRVFDVAVDLRKGSPTFLKFFGVELSENSMLSMLIPKGFAHGFQVLENDSALIYHHTSHYNAEYESGIRYDDNRINIVWKEPVQVISKRDSNFPSLKQSFTGI
ncbi:dTDP-4-dehydrorhamnose 3,5-epimerase [Jiulongibacter sediminis]|uniref:dTDP-4-dehydrorhamnose 3,5-epimerase n=1 Tax=Jiulongibacter sediminis TaxID=1605367 RepID=UPI0026F0277A|nr:dTDP-4-dehydrorhamnose 3,5-epimerase [Jiulongibacter sediminis]